MPLLSLALSPTPPCQHTLPFAEAWPCSSAPRTLRSALTGVRPCEGPGGKGKKEARPRSNLKSAGLSQTQNLTLPVSLLGGEPSPLLLASAPIHWLYLGPSCVQCRGRWGERLRPGMPGTDQGLGRHLVIEYTARPR